VRKLFILIFILLLVGCSSTKHCSNNERKNLMLLENTELGRNKEFHSKHNKKTKRKAYRKYKKNITYHPYKFRRYGGGMIGGTKY